MITGSADRSLKLWDISRKTYRQTTTFRHSSTAHCVDVSSDSSTAVSGHLDGGLRFWDIRTGDRTAEIASTYFISPKADVFTHVEPLTASPSLFQICTRVV